MQKRHARFKSNRWHFTLTSSVNWHLVEWFMQSVTTSKLVVKTWTGVWCVTKTKVHWIRFNPWLLTPLSKAQEKGRNSKVLIILTGKFYLILVLVLWLNYSKLFFCPNLVNITTTLIWINDQHFKKYYKYGSEYRISYDFFNISAF